MDNPNFLDLLLLYISSSSSSSSSCPQHTSHSGSSLATASSDGSLQTTLEEGLSFSVSLTGDQGLQRPLLCPLPPSQPLSYTSTPPPHTAQAHGSATPRGRSTALTLQATRGHQRSQSSCGGSISPGGLRQDSMDPSDEEVGTGSGRGGAGSQAFNSEHLSDMLSSLSLTSLLSPVSLEPPVVKKCNSTGSLNQANLSARSQDGRQCCGIDAHGYLSNPWEQYRGEQDGGFSMVNRGGDSQIANTSPRKNR